MSDSVRTTDRGRLEWAPDVTYLLLRIVAGLLIFQPGAMKILGWFGGMPQGAEMSVQVQIGGYIEIVGGLLVIIGLGTRLAAFVLSGMMAVAYFQFHQPNGTWPLQNQGVPAVALCFIFLYLAAKGAGSWSFDEWLRRRRG